jgi:hypothetical protein
MYLFIYIALTSFSPFGYVAKLINKGPDRRPTTWPLYIRLIYPVYASTTRLRTERPSKVCTVQTPPSSVKSATVSVYVCVAVATDTAGMKVYSDNAPRKWDPVAALLHYRHPWCDGLYSSCQAVATVPAARMPKSPDTAIKSAVVAGLLFGSFFFFFFFSAAVLQLNSGWKCLTIYSTIYLAAAHVLQVERCFQSLMDFFPYSLLLVAHSMRGLIGNWIPSAALPWKHRI